LLKSVVIEHIVTWNQSTWTIFANLHSGNHDTND